MNNEPEYRQPSMAGHYIVAASIILAAVILACLLIWFWHPCCCCCQRPQAGTSVTEFSAPNPYISGSAVNRLRGYPGQSRQQAVILPAGERAIPQADDVPPQATAAPDEYINDVVSGRNVAGHHEGWSWWTPNEYIGAVPAEASSAPASSSTVRKPVEVPEPGSLAMMLVGVPLIIAITRSRPLG